MPTLALHSVRGIHITLLHSAFEMSFYHAGAAADEVSVFKASHDAGLLFSIDEGVESSFAAMGRNPQRSNIALSSSQPLQSVVNIFSPVKMAFAPDMKQSICFSSLMVMRPAANLMIVVGMTSLAVAIVRTTESNGTGSLSPSGVPFIGTSAFTGKLSG